MNNEQWSIGAFVGDECRGEGRLVDGKFFITVHANSGEMISFKLYDQTSGQYFDIDQTVRMQQMLGTVNKPFGMTTKADTTTGIQSMDNVQCTMNNYDLGGRRIDSNVKGIQLQRTSDGKVKKVIK